MTLQRRTVRQSTASTAVSVIGVGSGGLQEMREYVDDASVAWALLRFQVGNASNARTKFISIHCNGEDVPTVKRGRLNARTTEVLQMFGDVYVNIEVKRKADITVDLLCEKIAPAFDSTSVGSAKMSLQNLKDEYEKMIADSAGAKDGGGAVSSKGPKTAKDRPEAGFNAKTCLEAAGATQGPFNWVLLEPTKLELHNAGYGGLDEMKQHLEVTKVLFGVIRFSFGRCEAACGSAFVPAVVKHVFIHFVGNKVPVVRRGQWNAKQNEAEKEVKNFCVPIFRKEAHAPDELNLEDMIKELQRLALSTQSGGGDADGKLLSVEEYTKALEQEKQEQMDGGTASTSLADGEMPEAKTAVETVRGTGGLWNWTLVGTTSPGSTQPSQSAMPNRTAATATTKAASPAKDDAVEKQAAEKAAAEKAAAEKAAADAKAAAEKAASEKAASEKATAEKAAAEKAAADKAAADKANAAENSSKEALDKAAFDAAVAKQVEEKLAAEKAAAEKAAFDAAVAKAVEERMKEERKSLALQSAPDLSVDDASKQKAKLKSCRSWDRLCMDEEAPLASKGGTCSKCGQQVEYCQCSDGDETPKVTFTVSNPCPDTFLGAFDCLAEKGVDQLGWFSSSMPPEEVVVVQVEETSWADKVGLKAGDELMELQGKDVSEVEQQEFVTFMHQRPLTLSFYRQDGAMEKMLQRGSLPSSRGSTPLRQSTVNKLNMKENVRESVVNRQNNDAFSTPSRTSQVVQAFPAWEDFCGELHIRSGWTWKRRFFQLAKGHLKWWQKKELFLKKPQPDPEVDLGLVEVMARWKVEGLKGSRFELNYHPVFKPPEEKKEEAKDEKEVKEGEKKERKSLFKRASNAVTRGSRARSSSVSSRKSDASSDGMQGASGDSAARRKVEKYLIAADDIASATEWARAIWHHIAYVDMLTLWPMPLEGRQGDISFYGIEHP